MTKSYTFIVRLLFAIFVLIISPMCLAQEYRAMYEGQEVNLVDGEVVNDLFILCISDGKKSVFQSYYTMQRDSVREKGIVQGLDRYAIIKNMRQIPPGSKNRVYYDKERDLFTEIDYGVLYFKTEDRLPTPTYSFSDSIKVVSGYESNMASAHFLGRDWVVYYTLDIPLPYGPWKINKLPGLVTEAYTLDGAYKFTLLGFEQCANKQNIEIPNKMLGQEIRTISKNELLWIRKLISCKDPRPIIKKYLKNNDMSEMHHNKIDRNYRERAKRYQYIEQ